MREKREKLEKPFLAEKRHLTLREKVREKREKPPAPPAPPGQVLPFGDAKGGLTLKKLKKPFLAEKWHVTVHKKVHKKLKKGWHLAPLPNSPVSREHKLHRASTVPVPPLG